LAPNVSDCTAKVVSSGSRLSANATGWPSNGTVDKSCDEFGHEAVSYLSSTFVGMIESSYVASVRFWPTKIIGMDKSTGLSSVSVPTTWNR
jgi:hypothetical protein